MIHEKKPSIQSNCSLVAFVEFTIDLYSDWDYCWDIHTVWRSFPNDTLPGTGSIFHRCITTAHTHSITAYIFFKRIQYQFISLYPAPHRVFVVCCTHKRVTNIVVVVSRFSCLLNTCLCRGFFQAHRIPYVCVYACAMYILFLVYTSLPIRIVRLWFVVLFSFYLVCNYMSGAHNWLISYSIDQTQHTPLLHTENSSVSVQLNVSLSSYMSNINKHSLVKLNLFFISSFFGDFVRTTNCCGVIDASLMRWFLPFGLAIYYKQILLNIFKRKINSTISELCRNKVTTFKFEKSAEFFLCEYKNDHR